MLQPVPVPAPRDKVAPKVKRLSGVPERLAVASAVLFVVMLGVAAYWDSSIRVLHAVEAVPYLFAAVLIIRQRPYGYLLGAASGAFWLWTGGFLTTFIKNGFERLASLILTGHVDRWDIFIAVPATFGAGGLVLFSAYSYIRLAQKSRLDALRLFATLIGVAGYFVFIFRIFAPQYLGMFGSLLPAFLRS